MKKIEHSDCLIVAGMAAIVTATFLLSVIAGVYALGVMLFLAGVWIAKGGGKK